MVIIMKVFRKLQVLIIFLLLVSVGTIVYHYAWKPLPSSYILYVAIFFLGITVTYELIYKSVLKNAKRTTYLEEKMKLWNNISFRVKDAGETSFNEMPLGIIVFDDDFIVEWSNHYAQQIFMSNSLNDRSLEVLDKEFAKLIRERKQNFVVTIYDKVYKVEHTLRDHVIYLTDITDETRLENKYKSRTLALGVLNLDNLDGAFSTLDAQERSLHMARIIGILTEWAKDYNICFKGYSDERYLLIMNYQIVLEHTKNGFPVLNKIQEYGEKEGIRITTSIGISCRDIDPVQLLDEANAQLELALNRGGNQAIVKLDDQISYYGATSASFETRTSVYIRIKSEELSDLIKNSKKVFIIGHREMDADSFGSCLATCKICQALGKDAKIILDEKQIDETVENVYKSIKINYSSLLDLFVTSSEAIKVIDENSLLIIVDCQYQNLLMNDKVYKKSKNIAIIDHHRRNPDAISNFKFLYIQPSASSAVELVAEMFDYIGCDVDISAIEATWMLMGIFVDTNSFIYRTTSRTFNVLAKLQSYGADMSKVQRFLRENYDEYVKRMAVLNNLEVLDGGFGIALCDNEIYERSFLAKIADNIITVNNIKVAFCIGRVGPDLIGISARSLDEANVQVIMERLGGGGHFNNAATQIHGITKEEAKARLIAVLHEDKDKGEKIMKVILTKDVKGKGKVNDLIDIPAGHANFLIRSGQAIEGTPENIKQLELSKIKEQQDQEKHLRNMQELKTKIENMTVKVSVKVGQNGKLFGTVSTKEIVEAFKNQNGIELDKRKILFDKTIDSLGTYKIPIELHKDVKAIITLYVVDQGVK